MPNFERSLILYAEVEDMDEIAKFFNDSFGMNFKLEGNDPKHWVVECGLSAIHICPENRHDPARKIDAPGTHGMWNLIKHKCSMG